MGERRWLLGVCAALVALVMVAFWPAVSAFYVSWDDRQNFVTNPMWWGLSGENVRWMLTTFHMGHWHPLTWLSFGLQYELIGGDPGASHAVNIGLHALNSVLFFLVVRRVLGMVTEEGAGGGLSRLGVVAAGLGAAYFAVHPLRVESVAWATERRDLLSTALLLGSLLAYLRAVGEGEGGSSGVRDRRWYWAAVVLLALSCASKAWGMSFFVVLMLLDVYPLRRVEGVRGWFTRAGLRVAVEKLPFAAIGVATAVVASKAQSAGMATKTLAEWGLVERAVQACYGLMFYLRQSVAPSGHSPLYELPVSVDPLEGRYVAGYVVVLALVVVGLMMWRRARGVTVGLLIYLVLVSPVLGVLQSGYQFVADRYSYLATMPLAVGLAWAAVWVVRRAEARRGAEGGCLR